MKKVKPAVWGVLVFIGLLFWGFSREADAAEHALTIGLGKGMLHENDSTTQQIGYEYNRRWYAKATLIDGRGVIDRTYRYTVGRRVAFRPGKTIDPYMRIGVGYFSVVPDELVNDHWVFDLGLGIDFNEIGRLEYSHNSTAGRSRPNTGVDMVLLTFYLKL